MKLLIASLFLFLFSFTPAQAAYNDVSLTTDTDILVGSDNISISGDTAVVQTLEVGSSSFNVTLNVATEGLSTITITSDGGKQIIARPESYTDTDDCSTLRVVGSGAPATVSFTIGSTCSGQARTTGGGNSGGGSSRRNQTAPALPPPAVPPLFSCLRLWVLCS